MRSHTQEFSMNRLLIGIALLSMTSIASAQTRSVFIEDLTSYELRDAMDRLQLNDSSFVYQPNRTGRTWRSSSTT